jgi:hypothetical protein
VEFGEKKGRNRIVDRNAPRIAIEISEIRVDEKQKTPATASLSRTWRLRIFPEQKQRKLLRQKSRRQIKTLCDRAAASERRPCFTLDFVFTKTYQASRSRVVIFDCWLARIWLDSFVVYGHWVIFSIQEVWSFPECLLRWRIALLPSVVLIAVRNYPRRLRWFIPCRV